MKVNKGKDIYRLLVNKRRYIYLYILYLSSLYKRIKSYRD